MVGSYLNDYFDEKELVLMDLLEFDVPDKSQVFARLKKHKPDVMLRLATETHSPGGKHSLVVGCAKPK